MIGSDEQVQKGYKFKGSFRKKREKDLKIKMFNHEYDDAKEKATEAGYPLATYARHAILNNRVVNRKSLKYNAKYLSQIAWIGNNLNQIARFLNAKKAQNDSDTVNLVELNLKLDDIQNELQTLVKIIEEENAS